MRDRGRERGEREGTSSQYQPPPLRICSQHVDLNLEAFGLAITITINMTIMRIIIMRRRTKRRRHQDQPRTEVLRGLGCLEIDLRLSVRMQQLLLHGFSDEKIRPPLHYLPTYLPTYLHTHTHTHPLRQDPAYKHTAKGSLEATAGS